MSSWSRYHQPERLWMHWMGHATRYDADLVLLTGMTIAHIAIRPAALAARDLPEHLAAELVKGRDTPVAPWRFGPVV